MLGAGNLTSTAGGVAAPNIQGELSRDEASHIGETSSRRGSIDATLPLGDMIEGLRSMLRPEPQVHEVYEVEGVSAGGDSGEGYLEALGESVEETILDVFNTFNLSEGTEVTSRADEETAAGSGEHFSEEGKLVITDSSIVKGLFIDNTSYLTKQQIEFLSNADKLEKAAKTKTGWEKELALRAAIKYRELANQPTKYSQDTIGKELMSLIVHSQFIDHESGVGLSGRILEFSVDKLGSWGIENAHQLVVASSCVKDKLAEEIGKVVKFTLGKKKTAELVDGIAGTVGTIESIALTLLSPHKSPGEGEKYIAKILTGAYLAKFGARTWEIAGGAMKGMTFSPSLFKAGATAEITALETSTSIVKFGGISAEAIESASGAGVAHEMEWVRNKAGKLTGVTHTQKHHIVHQTIADHELFSLAGITVEDKANKMLLPTSIGSKYTNTDRTVHNGRHAKEVKEELEARMDRVLEIGKERGYSQERYRDELKSIMAEEYHRLKAGERGLNNATDFRARGGN